MFWEARVFLKLVTSLNNCNIGVSKRPGTYLEEYMVKLNALKAMLDRYYLINSTIYSCKYMKSMALYFIVISQSCADPEILSDGVQIWREDRNTTLSGPSLTSVSLACWWWPNIERWLGSFEIFQGIQTSIAKKPYKFEIVQGGSRPHVPSSGSAHVSQ